MQQLYDTTMESLSTFCPLPPKPTVSCFIYSRNRKTCLPFSLFKKGYLSKCTYTCTGFLIKSCNYLLAYSKFDTHSISFYIIFMHEYKWLLISKATRGKKFLKKTSFQVRAGPIPTSKSELEMQVHCVGGQRGGFHHFSAGLCS